MEKRPELNISEVIAIILEIESRIGIKCLSYGLYDKTNKEYITDRNKDNSYDYYEAYDNRCRFRYTHSLSLKDDYIIYLLKHHGELYFPMLKKGTQKSYVAQFDVKELIDKYGSNYSITPSTYFTKNYTWFDKKQCKGQLALPLTEMR